MRQVRHVIMMQKSWKTKPPQQVCLLEVYKTGLALACTYKSLDTF